VSGGSFEAFVTDRSTELLRTAYLLTGDRRSAQELLQTALIAAHRHWDQLADADRATVFVRRAVVTASTGWRRWLRVGDLLSSSQLLAGAEGLSGFGRPAADPGERDRTTVALEALAPRMRAALVLRYGDELSAADTAELLGCPVDTVVADTDRGLAQLGNTGAGLARQLRERAQQVTAVPDDVRVSVLEGALSRRRHRWALAALLAVLVGIVLLVWLNLPATG
jgi:DNA-directed RNA polymerase specialized sigma24 family protein